MSDERTEERTPVAPEPGDVLAPPVHEQGGAAPAAPTAGLAGGQMEPVGGAPPPVSGVAATASPPAARAVATVGDLSDTDDNGSQMIDYERTFTTLKEGDVVRGKVVHIDREGVLVDVGTKSEGLIPPNELSREPGASADAIVRVGDPIDVYVMDVDDQEGNLILSKKRADFEKAWDRVIEAQNDNRTIHAMVSDRVKGGLVVDLGIRGFVPASHVGSGKVRNLEKYVGQSLPLKVIEVDRDRRKVVLSHRLATEEEREAQKAETLATLAEGQVRKGVVRRITDYGAFVDIGGVDGLLHISEMSWTRIKHPSDVLKVGDDIQVMVLKTNLEQGRISLGLRQILPDPWIEARDHFQAGDVIIGVVTRLVPFGAFVQLDGGIEGIIPNSELATRRVNKPEEVVQVGDHVEVKILDIRPEERRMTLSLRQAQGNKDRRQYQEFQRGQREDRVTIGDMVGDVLENEEEYEEEEE
jgi:small subunit ribosomal protein S1